MFCEFCGARIEENRGTQFNPSNGQQSFRTNNQFVNQQSPDMNRGFNVPPVQNNNPYPPPQMQNQRPPVNPVPLMKTQAAVRNAAPANNFQQQNNEMNEIYHKYMDDQYVTVDSKGNSIVAAGSNAVQGTGDSSEFSKGFKIFAVIMSVLSALFPFLAVLEFIIGIIFSSNGSKAEGKRLKFLAVLCFFLGIVARFYSLFY